jgi:hypothetical protein
MNIYRIRQYSAVAGGSHFYWHADVVAPHWATALKAARDGKIKNWRYIDHFDKSTHKYKYYEYLYKVDGRDAQRPREIGYK